MKFPASTSTLENLDRTRPPQRNGNPTVWKQLESRCPAQLKRACSAASKALYKLSCGIKDPDFLIVLIEDEDVPIRPDVGVTQAAKEIRSPLVRTYSEDDLGVQQSIPGFSPIP